MNGSSAVPRYCKACGGDLRPPSGMVNGVWSTILADDGEYHYSCWAGPANRLAAEIARLRTALQNCRMFFDANNRPNYVAMIDAAMGNEQKVGDTK